MKHSTDSTGNIMMLAVCAWSSRFVFDTNYIQTFYENASLIYLSISELYPNLKMNDIVTQIDQHNVYPVYLLIGFIVGLE